MESAKGYTPNACNTCVTLSGKKIRLSRLMRAVLEILNNKLDESLSLGAIAEELGKGEGFGRKSALRVSLSRCLNRMQKFGLVDWQYTYWVTHNKLHIAKPCDGKFWFIPDADSDTSQFKKRIFSEDDQ